jgi:hypothetical protein
MTPDHSSSNEIPEPSHSDLRSRWHIDIPGHQSFSLWNVDLPNRRVTYLPLRITFEMVHNAKAFAPELITPRNIRARYIPNESACSLEEDEIGSIGRRARVTYAEAHWKVSLLKHR